MLLNLSYTVVIGGIEEVLSAKARHLLLSSLQRCGELLDLANEEKVDGLLVVDCDIDDADLERLWDSSRPVVLLDHSFPAILSVTTNQFEGDCLAGLHLLERCCKQPAFVAENMANPSLAMPGNGAAG